jgi:hypothetical protein
MNSEVIVAFITGVLGPVILLILQNRYNKNNKKRDIVKDTLQVSEVVLNKLESIREVTHADRAWICQFHNGGNFYPTGKSMAKFSMLYEVVNSGVSSIQNNFQNIPVNLFSKSINHLLNENVIEIPDYKDEKISTYGLKYVAEESGCKSGYLFSIKTIDDKFIAIMGLDFTKRKTTLSQEQINELSIKATSIGGALMNYLNK